MNKKLLAVAIAGALAMPAAAMADATVYGKVHISVESYSHGDYELDTDPGTTGNQSAGGKGLEMSNNSSRLGFKGSDDLGGGLTAVWQYEFSVNPVESAAVNANRNSFAGLKGGFGTVLLGRHDSPSKSVSRKADFFVDQIGDSRVIVRGDVLGGSNVDMEDRNTQMLMYITPKLGAIEARLQYVPDTNTDDDNDASKLNASVSYGQGPLYVGLGYNSEQVNGETGTGYTLVGTYKMDALKFAAQYTSVSNATFAASNELDWTAYGVGASFDLGGGNILKAQYFANDVDADDANSSLIAVGYDKKFTKQTTAYVSYASVSNDDNIGATVTVGTGHGGLGTNAVQGGETSSALSVGVIHVF